MHEAIDTWKQNGVECNLYVDYDSGGFSPREDFEHLGTFVCREQRDYSLPQEVKGFKFENFDCIEDAIDYLKENHGAVHIYPVWMYDHSNVSFSMGESNPYSCQWDSSLCGVIFTTEARMDEFGITDRSESNIQKQLDDEVEEYSSWASGDVYYFVIDTPDGNGDSCSGLIGYEYAHSEAEMAFEFEHKHYIERRDKELDEREYWECRDVITI